MVRTKADIKTPNFHGVITKQVLAGDITTGVEALSCIWSGQGPSRHRKFLNFDKCAAGLHVDYPIDKVLRWPLPTLHAEDVSQPSPHQERDAPPPFIRGGPSYEVAVHLAGDALCYFDVESWRCIHELVDACTDPGCSNTSTQFIVSQIVVQIYSCDTRL